MSVFCCAQPGGFLKFFFYKPGLELLSLDCTHVCKFSLQNDFFQFRTLLDRNKETTRWLAFAALKETYDQCPSALDDAMAVVYRDLQTLLTDGIQLQVDGSNVCLRLAVTGIKGDWPFLISAAHLVRSFRRQPKRGQSTMNCPGICHICLAGQHDFHFTDMSENPCWAATIGSACANTPWDTISPWHNFDTYIDCPPWQFRPDIFHNWHLGAGRYFLASALVVIQKFEEGGGVDARFEELTRKWLSFCKSRRVSWPENFTHYSTGCDLLAWLPDLTI